MSRNTLITIVVIILLIVVGYVAAQMINPTRDPNTTTSPAPTGTSDTNTTTQSTTTNSTSTSTSTSATQTYTLAEVAKHNKSTDCWLAISGKVYNVTPFIASGKHPGGAAILQGCGKDATTLFETRPMGSGTPHSEQAHNNLVNFYIGDLKS
jgi:cytochrome b involved in lipid metabolism